MVMKLTGCNCCGLTLVPEPAAEGNCGLELTGKDLFDIAGVKFVEPTEEDNFDTGLA